MTAVLPSGVVTVAFPLSSTATVASGFTALTLSSIAFFSSGVKLAGSLTAVLSAGLTMSFPAFGLAASSGDLVKSDAGIVATAPSFVVTVAFPLSSNTTLASGFTALILSSIAFFSSGVKVAGSFTTTLSAGVFTLFPAFGVSLAAGSFTKSSTGIVAVLPSGVDTVAFPFSSTNTLASGLTASTLALIALMSSGVNASLFADTLSAGLLTSLPAFAPSASAGDFTKSVTGIVAVCPSGVTTVAFPLSSTTTVAPGFTASTLALIASMFSGVNASLSATTLSAGLLMLFPALAVSLSASVFTKSAFGITTVLPSGVVTVAFPLSSTTTVEPGLTASTLALIASLASFGKSLSAATSAGSTTTLSAGLFTASCFVGSAKSALGFTKSLAGIVAVLPSGVVTVAFPFSSNTTSAPGFTAWIFALTVSFSLSVNAAGFSTTTLSAGVFTWFPPLTSSLSVGVFTNSLTGIVAVLPSGVVTVAFPFSSTTTVEPGFTASTAALILAISSGDLTASLSATCTLSAGLLMLLPAFGEVFSSAPLTKSSASITAVFPSGVVTVAFPFSSTVTTAPGFTALTLSSIAFFSSGVKAFLSATTVCEFGLLMSSPPFAFLASSGVLNKSDAGIVATVPFGRTTVAFPSSSYLTLVPGPFNF